MTIFRILLNIHIIGGFISLIVGVYILTQKKGDKRHKLLGQIYFYSMLAASFVSLPMAYLHPNYFLFIIGVFTSYMLLSGKRYLQKKKTEDVQKIDWLLTGIMFLFGLGFIGFGVFNFLKGNYFGTVFLVFGGFSLFFVKQDYQNFKGLTKIKNYWLTTHIVRMVGSYIASATAFLVVNQPPISSVLAWILPTLVLTPLILLWVKKYKVLKKHEI